MTFEEAYTKLSEIAISLQNADIGLDDTVKLLEQAVELKKICEEKLKQTEGKILVFKQEIGELKPLDGEDKDAK